MSFEALQVTKTYQQKNIASPEKVFPLLCPVREADWLDGWQYDMIYSKSGLVEEGCVFATPHHGHFRTIWVVTKHDPENYIVEFVRYTPEENVVRIYISLDDNEDGTTTSNISYQYTALREKQNKIIEQELDKSFKKSMEWWEKAINHYLKTGKMLKNE